MTVRGVSAASVGVWRRLACFIYEGVLLFGVVMAAGLVYAVATRQQHALVGTHGLQLWIFAVLGAYFIWFWSHGGQTLAMRTWQIKLVTQAGGAVSYGRAACRYLLSWLWFAPALLAVWTAGLKEPLPFFSVMIAGVLAYAALARLHPERQYLHDAACGTRLIFSRSSSPLAST